VKVKQVHLFTIMDREKEEAELAIETITMEVHRNCGWDTCSLLHEKLTSKWKTKGRAFVVYRDWPT
jgi:hypothetical protein